jgi:hypothetical protein
MTDMGDKKLLRHAWAPLLLAGAIAFGAYSCRGPKPAVLSQELRPPESKDGPYSAVVMIENQGGGKGEIEVIARLRSRATGQVLDEHEQVVDLPSNEKVQLVIELRSTLPEPYDLDVKVKYPP